METLVAPVINLLILIVFLGYKLKKPVQGFVAQRHVSIRDEIKNVHEQLKQAQEKYDEFSAKLKAVDAEVATLREQMRQETTAMKQRMTSETQRVASMIVSDAKKAAESLYGEFRNQLYAEFGTRVLDRAEEIIRGRLTGDDRARIRQEFSRQLETIR